MVNQNNYKEVYVSTNNGILLYLLCKVDAGESMQETENSTKYFLVLKYP